VRDTLQRRTKFAVGSRYLLRGLCAAICAVGMVVLGTATPALAKKPLPYPPLPWCSPWVGQPFAYPPTSDVPGVSYDFFSEVDGSLDCAGAIYDSSVTVIFHYATYEFGSQIASGAVSGAGHECMTSCSATGYYDRTGLFCASEYNFQDYGQITGWWQRTSSTSRVSFSLDGKTTYGSAYNPPGPCS
jgi:hypothetical protein